MQASKTAVNRNFLKFVSPHLKNLKKIFFFKMPRNAFELQFDGLFLITIYFIIMLESHVFFCSTKFERDYCINFNSCTKHF